MSITLPLSNIQEFLADTSSALGLSSSKTQAQKASQKYYNSTHSDQIVENLFNGNVKELNEYFDLKPKMNPETKVLERVIESLTNTHLSAVIFTFKDNKLTFNIDGETYDFYDLIQKVQWNHIHASKEVSEAYNKLNLNYGGHDSFDGIYRAQSYYWEDSKKSHLYQNLNDAEKRAVYVYTTGSSFINKLLRGDLNYLQDLNNRARSDAYYDLGCDFDYNQLVVLDALSHMYLSYYCNSILMHTYMLCSALNKIPDSAELVKSKYVYRGANNKANVQMVHHSKSLVEQLEESVESDKHLNFTAFTSTSYGQPQKSFISDKYDGVVQVFLNPKGQAKDISGLSPNPAQNECVFLPNTKMRAIKKLEYQKPFYDLSNSWYYQQLLDTAVKTNHVFLTQIMGS